MNLTEEQQEALKKGEAVPVTVGDTRCVVLTEEHYERLKAAPIDYDDSDYSPREHYAFVLEVLDQDDENPDEYLEYLKD